MFVPRMLRILKLTRKKSLKNIRNIASHFSAEKNNSKCNHTYQRNSNLPSGHPSKYAYLWYTTSVPTDTEEVDKNLFEKVCAETLESLTEYFEELVESNNKLESADISYSSGVLTVNLAKYGTYVINRQSPNKQIWLSSPLSGPKRYDFVPNGSYWIYKHHSEPLHELLQRELSSILDENIDMSRCLHYKT